MNGRPFSFSAKNNYSYFFPLPKTNPTYYSDISFLSHASGTPASSYNKGEIQEYKKIKLKEKEKKTN